MAGNVYLLHWSPFPHMLRWMTFLQTNPPQLQTPRLPEEHWVWTCKQEQQGHRSAVSKKCRDCSAFAGTATHACRAQHPVAMPVNSGRKSCINVICHHLFPGHFLLQSKPLITHLYLSFNLFYGRVQLETPQDKPPQLCAYSPKRSCILPWTEGQSLTRWAMDCIDRPTHVLKACTLWHDTGPFPETDGVTSIRLNSTLNSLH